MDCVDESKACMHAGVCEGEEVGVIEYRLRNGNFLYIFSFLHIFISSFCGSYSNT